MNYIPRLLITTSALLLSCTVYAVDIPQEEIGAQRLDQIDCMQDNDQNCSQMCMNSEDTDCQDKCKKLVSDKCQTENDD